MKRLQFTPVFLTVSSFFLITFLLCIVFDMAFPMWSMIEIWKILLPGFTGLSTGDILIGALGVVGYGVYTAALFVPLSNYFHKGRSNGGA